MSGRQPPHNHGEAPLGQKVRIGAQFANQPAIFWVAALAALGVIIGGIGPWAIWLNTVSISGTGMHGWREVGVGGVGLVMLGLYQLRRGRLPLVVAGVAGCLGAIGAVAILNKIRSGGTVTLFGVEYRYMSAAWGLYLVLGGTILQALCTAGMVWRDAARLGRAAAPFARACRPRQNRHRATPRRNFGPL